MPTASTFYTLSLIPHNYGCITESTSAIDNWTPDGTKYDQVLIRGLTLDDIMPVLWNMKTMRIDMSCSFNIGQYVEPNYSWYSRTAWDWESQQIETDGVYYIGDTATAPTPAYRVCAGDYGAWHFYQYGTATSDGGPLSPRMVVENFDLDEVLKQGTEYAIVFRLAVASYKSYSYNLEEWVYNKPLTSTGPYGSDVYGEACVSFTASIFGWSASMRAYFPRPDGGIVATAHPSHQCVFALTVSAVETYSY